MLTFHVYILHCSDGSYYVGHTDNIEKRISEHSSGKFSGYTSSRLPVKSVFVQEFTSRYEEISAEQKIKGWSRDKKEALIAQDWNLLSQLSQRRK